MHVLAVNTAVVGAKEPKQTNLNRDEDIHRTLGKENHDGMIDPEEIAAKLNEIHEHSKSALDELKVQSNKVIDSAKSQSTSIIDSAKYGFGILQKSQPNPEPVNDDEEDPYAVDVSNENGVLNAPADVVAKLDEVREKSWSALDELMSQSNKIIDTAKHQSNQIIESALTNLTLIEKTSNASSSQDAEDRILHIL